MKLAMINTVNLEDNGITTFIIDNSILLAQHHISVTIVAPNRVSDTLRKKLNNNNIDIFEIPYRSKRTWKYFNTLRKYLKNESFDVVHVNGNSTTMSIELLAAFFAGVKGRIAHSHNTTTDHPKINQALRPIFEILVNGRIACNNAAGKWLFKNQNFEVIKNGIFLRNYTFSYKKRNDIRKMLHLKENDILLGHIGRFNDQKNQKYFFKIIPFLPQNYHLILVGQGMNFEKIKQEVRKRGLINRIFFTGAINNTSDYLSAMDLFLLPSIYEGQPFTLVESTASGLYNVVSSRVSMENNVADNMISISLDNPTKWKDRIEQYNFSNMTSRRQDTSNNFIEVLKDHGYDVETNAQKLIDIYSKICK